MSGQITLDKRALEQLLVHAPGHADAVLEQAAQIGVELARSSFGTSPEGRRYRRQRSLHVASQPGYPPNVDSGRLRRALTVERPGLLRRTITTGDVSYAAALEYGGRNQAARPFLRPMLATLAGLLPGLFAAVTPASPHPQSPEQSRLNHNSGYKGP